MENEVTGFLFESPTKKSSMRLFTLLYLILICIPGSLWTLYLMQEVILSVQTEVSSVGMLIFMFLLLQVGWIAPKTLAKITENKTVLDKLMIDKK